MLDLSHYEMLDLAATHASAAVDDLNRALALGSAYLIVAYRAGRELTTLQVSIINIGFVIFCGQALMGIYTEVDLIAEFRTAAYGEEGLSGSLANVGMFHFVMGSVAVSGLIACLVFMWSVRHPKTE
jgi:hypothetical protein